MDKEFIELNLSEGERINPREMGKEHELFLIRIKEGTYFSQHPIEKIVSIRWKENPFIPVIGIEVKKTESEKMEGFIKYKSVEAFHEYSFMEI